jgi:hypothetical protein
MNQSATSTGPTFTASDTNTNRRAATVRTSLLALACTALLSACGGAPESWEEGAEAEPGEEQLAFGGYHCTIQTQNGQYVSVNAGGGRTADPVLQTTTTMRPRDNERLLLHPNWDYDGDLRYAIGTTKGYNLSAVNTGGLSANAFWSNQTWIGTWEMFKLVPIGGTLNQFAIQTISGHYWKAQGGGGQARNAITTDATSVRGWETFTVKCGVW